MCSVTSGKADQFLAECVVGWAGICIFEYIPNEKDKKAYLIEIINAIKSVVNFDDYYKYITAEQLRHHIQPHIDNTFDVLY